MTVRLSGSVTEVGRPIVMLETTVVTWLSALVTVIVAVVPGGIRYRDNLNERSFSTDQDGKFTVRGLTPGNYKLFAWEDIEPFSYFDPDILREYEQKGKAVTVHESGKESVEMKIIPAASQ